MMALQAVAAQAREARVRELLYSLHREIRQAQRLSARSEWASAEAHREVMDTLPKLVSTKRIAVLNDKIDVLMQRAEERAFLPEPRSTIRRQDVELLLVQLLSRTRRKG